MNFTDHSSADFVSLIEKISAIINEKGLKATTMDLVASRLQMSKRTLYEIFGNKNQMILETIRFSREKHVRLMEKTFAESSNVMEALLTVFKAQQHFIKTVNAKFFRDFDSYYHDLRDEFDKQSRMSYEGLMWVIKRGISQGVFRKDVNYTVTLALMRLQMESLKRMEELFPPQITLQEAFDVICVGFFRSIASPEGMKIIDDVLNNDASFSNVLHDNPTEE